ncbi:MAG: holo-ACP synthase [Desulfuromonadaceae bacterium]|nr:holo-ACP synthase [Desulfuromonas sp.]MDY0184798.1 holo-ACP synthase [Desulfuromonadaceae bacterium]
MAVAGIGTDIVHVERFAEFIARNNRGVLERLFTPAELEYSLPRRQAPEHLAARFAAKEAFLKALGTGLRDGLSWLDMEVRRDHYGAPSLHLAGATAQAFSARGLQTIFLSYSHEREYAVATVVLEGA